MLPKIEIIVVKYNQPDFEATTMVRVAQSTFYTNYSLRAHQNEKGVALSKCWNKLIEQSDAEYICLLNSDTAVTTNWLIDMMNVFQCVENVGGVVPSSNIVFHSQIEVPFDRACSDFQQMNAFAADNAKDGRCIELPTLSAMCVLFKKSDWKEIGGFDEEFFLYGEDSEFFYRLAQKTGKQLLWYCGAYVHHYKAQSVQKAMEAGELDYEEVLAEANRLCKLKAPGLNIGHGIKQE